MFFHFIIIFWASYTSFKVEGKTSRGNSCWDVCSGGGGENILISSTTVTLSAEFCLGTNIRDLIPHSLQIRGERGHFVYVGKF